MMGNDEETEHRSSRFLTAAEYFLRQRNFSDCVEYARRAGDSDLTQKNSSQILAIASVLSSTHHDYYTILNLPYFESDSSKIKSNFETVVSILHPNVNPYPHASEATVMVSEAWSVLSNPMKKAKFDEELKRRFSGGKNGAFWTICPYCYYVYEYDSVYEGCCLRCANERCRKVMYAAAIGVPPPYEVIQKGYYWCPGFMPLEVRKSNGEEIGENSWFPFAVPSESADCKQKILRDDVMNFCDRNRKAEVWKESGSWNSSNGDQVCSMYEDGVGKNGGEDSGTGLTGKAMNGIDGPVEFFDGDDDVMVGFECDFDMENGELGLSS